MPKEGDRLRLEGAFFETLLGLNYAKGERFRRLVREAQQYACQLPPYAQWPQHAQQFWNAEAVCWKGRVDPAVRKAISRELSALQGLNLDLGAGSSSYTTNSVAADFAEEMLLVHDAPHKVALDLEKPLPLASEVFDSVTMVFVANYLANLPQLLREAKRVLAPGGQLVMVQSLAPVMELHRMHYRNSYGEAELKVLLKHAGFAVRSELRRLEGKELLFVRGKRGPL